MKLLLRLLSTAILVLIIDYFMDGIAVATFITSITIAVVLGLLNIFLKPILVLFTLPVTIFSLGLFLLVINAIIILLCAKLVDGFVVNSFFTAVIFSVVLSVSQSITNFFLKD